MIAIGVQGILAVARPATDGRPAVPQWWRDAAVQTFVPVPLIGGHNSSDAQAPIIGVVDRLGHHAEGWAWSGHLADPAWIAVLRRIGELPISAEYRAWPGAASNPSDITVQSEVPGVVIAVAALVFEPGAHPGSMMWLDPTSLPFLGAVGQ